MSAAGIELNLPDLPDLPEVPISLGPLAGAASAAGAGGAGGVAARPAVPWGTRVRDAATAYLPLLLMVLLALGTWWLVENSPQPPVPREAVAPRSEPDYTMGGFSVQRFARDGKLKLRIDGRQMRHFPDTDRIDIEDVTIQAFAPDGRITKANARQAVANGDGSEVQLLGGAKVQTTTPAGAPIELESEFLHAFVDTERVTTHLPVRVRYGGSTMNAAGLDFDNLAQKLELKGPMRGVLPAPRKGGGAR